jgi:hypothetical protein
MLNWYFNFIGINNRVIRRIISVLIVIRLGVIIIMTRLIGKNMASYIIGMQLMIQEA